MSTHGRVAERLLRSPYAPLGSRSPRVRVPEWSSVPSPPAGSSLQPLAMPVGGGSRAYTGNNAKRRGACASSKAKKGTARWLIASWYSIRDVMSSRPHCCRSRTTTALAKSHTCSGSAAPKSTRVVLKRAIACREQSSNAPAGAPFNSTRDSAAMSPSTSASGESHTTRRTEAGSTTERYGSTYLKGEITTGSRSRRRKCRTILARAPPTSRLYVRNKVCGNSDSRSLRNHVLTLGNTIRWTHREVACA